MHKGLPALLVFISLMALGCAQNGQPVAKGGIITLPGPEVMKKSRVELRGDWGFDFQSFSGVKGAIGAEKPQALVRVPGRWNGTMVNGRPVPGTGYASYSLKIMNLEAGVNYALSFYAIGTAYSVFVDGKYYGGMGRPGRDRQETRPFVGSRVVEFTAMGNEARLVMHVANFHDKNGGFWRTCYLGRAEVIRQNKIILTLTELIMIGILFMGGLIQLTLFFLNRSNRTFLFFGIFCILICLRTIIEGEWFISSLFPGIPFEILFKVLYLVSFSAFPVYGFYIYGLYPRQGIRAVNLFPLLSWVVIVILTVFTPLRVYSYSLYYINVAIPVFGVYSLAVIFRAVAAREKGAVLSLVSVLILMGGVVNDTLQAITLNQSPSTAQFSLMIFLLIENIELIIRYSRMMNQENTQSLTPQLLSAFSERCGLSGRETEILPEQVSGKTNEEIARALGIALSTVKKHINSIYAKTGASNRLELIQKIRQG